MTARPRRRNAVVRGYTFVELLMSMLILTIGVTGVIAMQKITITANQHAKNLALATQISQAWIDQLHADAVAWNHPSAQNAGSDLGETAWLSNVQLMNKDWIRPAWVEGRAFGPAFDAQGDPIDPTDAAAVRFCTHIRLSWLFQPSGGGTVVTGNGLIRAEVRVFWLREGQAGIDKKPLCSGDVNPKAVGAAENRNSYHFVYTVSAVRENTAR